MKKVIAPEAPVLSVKEFFESHYKTLDDVAKDELFDHYLEKHLKVRKNRPMPPVGQRYKRGPWDYLNEKGLFKLEDFKAFFELVENRQLSAPSVVRGYMSDIVKRALEDVISYRYREFIGPKIVEK